MIWNRRVKNERKKNYESFFDYSEPVYRYSVFSTHETRMNRNNSNNNNQNEFKWNVNMSEEKTRKLILDSSLLFSLAFLPFILAKMKNELHETIGNKGIYRLSIL